MVRRTARSGPRAGEDFWGCSTFPRCRNTAPIGGPDTDRRPSIPSTVFHRRQVWADYGRRGAWSSFYAPAGGRLRAWDALRGTRLHDNVPRSMSHAAFYLAGMPSAGTEALVVVDVLRRLLTRGDRPPVDPEIESWILNASGFENMFIPSRDPGDLSLRPAPATRLPSHEDVSKAARWRLPFEPDPSAQTIDGKPLIDSDIEQEFLAGVTRAAPTLGHWVTPQAGLGPLLGQPQDQRRLDFLIAHPATEPHVFELDGAQHRTAEAVDADRDASLRSVGIGVTRLGRPQLAGSLIETLVPWRHATASATPSAHVLRLVWAPPVAHRLARCIVEGIASGALTGKSWRLRVEEPTGVGLIATKAALEVLSSVADVWASEVAPDLVVLETDGAVNGLRRVSTGS